MKKPIKKKKTATGEDCTPIELNPKLNETVVFSWARMNPPTRGHEKLIDHMMQYECDQIVHLSHSELNKRNPLSYSDKIEYAKIAFGDIIQESDSRNIVTSIKSLREQYKNIILVVGSDRVEEFTEMFSKYNDRDFKFESWDVISAGYRDIDGSGVERVSASELREAFLNDDYDLIEQYLPENLMEYAYDIQNKIYEVYDVNEALSVVQRIKRGQQMKRHKEILKVTRKRALKRKANKGTIEKRAKRSAISTLKSRFSGNRDVKDLSPAEKARVEDLLKKRKGIVTRLARKLVVKVRKTDNDRLSK